MAQVITPPPADPTEQASKNWYKSEALRSVLTSLSAIYVDVEDMNARSFLKSAIDLIEKARAELSPPPKPVVPRVRSK